MNHIRKPLRSTVSRLSVFMVSFSLSGFLLQGAQSYGFEFKGTDVRGENSRLRSKDGKSLILVRVNGEGISAEDLEKEFDLRMIPQEMRDKLRDQILGDLIDSRLMRAYLTRLQIKIPESEVNEKLTRLEEMLAKRPDGQVLLQKLRENREFLRDDIAIPLMWRNHMRQTITDQQIIGFFEEHRDEFDGTKIHAKHLLLKAPPGTSDEESARMERELSELRELIVNGKTSFEAAATKVSQAPSGKTGGDLGKITWGEAMPESFCRVAFKLPVGEVSQPFRTHFGWHLCLVIERIPGDLSIEDARREIVSRLTQEEWERRLEKLRETAKIESVAK